LYRYTEGTGQSAVNFTRYFAAAGTRDAGDAAFADGASAVAEEAALSAPDGVALVEPAGASVGALPCTRCTQ
jgi:hypothetical protein